MSLVNPFSCGAQLGSGAPATITSQPIEMAKKKRSEFGDVRQLLTTSREYREYFAVFFKHNRFPTQENRFPLEDLAGCPHVLPVPCCSEFTKHIFKGLMIAYTDHIMKGNNRK